MFEHQPLLWICRRRLCRGCVEGEVIKELRTVHKRSMADALIHSGLRNGQHRFQWIRQGFGDASALFNTQSWEHILSK